MNTINNNQSTQSVSTNNTITNKENTLITVNQVQQLLNKYNEVQQERAELQATLDNYKTLQTQAEKNNTAIVKRMIEINDAIKSAEDTNKSLQKAVEAQGNVQQVINTQKECFAILDEIEEMMTSPEKVAESNAIAECKEALQKVEKTRDSLVIPTECNTVVPIQAGEKVTALLSALKAPVERPIIKAKKVKVKAEPAKSESPERQAASTVAEVAETVTAVETVSVVENHQPETETEKLTEKEQTEKFFEELAKAEKTQQEIIKVASKVTTTEFPVTTHKLKDGTVIEWKEAALSEIVIAVDEEGNNLTEDIIDFLDEFLGDENFDASEPYTFETHQQFRKSAPNAPQIEEAPILKKVVQYVHFVIKSFYCVNIKAVNPINEHDVIQAVNILKDQAFYEGCALDGAICF